jgi:hypothetical protein
VAAVLFVHAVQRAAHAFLRKRHRLDMLFRRWWALLATTARTASGLDATVSYDVAPGPV